VLRGKDRKVFREFLAQAAPTWRSAPGVRRIVDVDPRSMM